MTEGMFEVLVNLQRLNAENRQPRPSQRNSGCSRRVKNGLDRDICVQSLNAFREKYKMQLSSHPFTITTSFAQESPTASAPLSSLKAITLQQLIVGKRHYGRVLRGHLCVKPFKLSAIVSVLEDEAGNGARLMIYNVLSAAASPQEIEARFPSGMRVIVKEPFFKFCVDGKTAIRVDNPADIALDETWKKDMSPLDSCDNAAALMAELEAIRSEGNELFGSQNWIGAVNKYSECIDKAMCKKLGMQNSKTMRVKFKRVVMLTYSNRAEARLRLGAYEDALIDADKALEFDQKHVKTLVRKGKAACGLGLFEKSGAIFKAALERSPNEVSILDNLKASTIALEQSRTGEYDLSNYYSRRCTDDVPACADFIGPVEIRRVHRGFGRRGLFATATVETGQLLLVSNPLAIVRRKADFLKLNVSFSFHKRGGYNGDMITGVQQDILAELADRSMKSKRTMAQLYSLSSYGKLEMEIPSMELFRPGSEWVPPGSEKMEIDMALIREIAKLNAFSDSIHELHNRVAKGDHAPFKDVSSGIWALPSFANHSCTPNCVFSFIGDAMFIRAALPIAEGEELTVPYFEIFEGVETRQSCCKNWYFTCKCERCQLEETLKPQLAKISKAIPNLVKAAEAESLAEEGQHNKRQKAEELAKVADVVEALIQSRDTTLGPRQQGWIRAAFIAAYNAKFRLAMDEHDSQSRIATLRVIVDSMASVSVTEAVLDLAAILLLEVKQRYFKHSQSYRLTLDRVLGIYRVMFGKQPNSVLHNLIRARWAARS